MQYFCGWLVNGVTSKHSCDRAVDTILLGLTQLRKATLLSFAPLVHTQEKIFLAIGNGPSSSKSTFMPMDDPCFDNFLSRWLYAFFVSLDANFCLKRRHISSDAKDPGLSRGWGYFVDDSKYKAYLNTHVDARQEVSMCECPISLLIVA